MKIALALSMIATASAYCAPTMTFAIGKKKAAKPAPMAASRTIPSKALPYENAPATLDGSLPGDVGFDPCFLSGKQADLMSNYFNGIITTNPGLDGLTWYREVELMHGRIAQLAVLGFIFPGYYHFPGDEQVGLDAFSYTNPLEAPSHIPIMGTLQILLFMAGLEWRRIDIISTEGSNYQPGDFKWGQGEGRWNPFGFKYTEEEYRAKQIQETKHGRLAMIAFLGLVFQANASGVGVLDQLGPAFAVPEYYAKAGYFLPEGI
jgi:light-harvesting complex I chlorophyll a/b binding protein 1